jgi:CRP-like cAMP-binding protein
VEIACVPGSYVCVYPAAPTRINGVDVKITGRGPLSLQDDVFFHGFEPPLVARIEALVYQREFDARQIIYFPGDRCDQVYWVRRGRIRVARISDDGRELTFRHCTRGALLGEESLAGRPKREDHAEAMEPSLLLLMRADDFMRCVAEEAEFGLAVARWLCKRTIETEQVLAEAVFHSVRSRVAAGLLRLYRKEGHVAPAALSVTHQELANLIGSTRETTTATLHALRRDGIVQLANRRLTIVDPAALEMEARKA